MISYFCFAPLSISLPIPIFTSTDGEYSCQAIIIDSIFLSSHTRVSGKANQGGFWNHPNHAMLLCTAQIYIQSGAYFLFFSTKLSLLLLPLRSNLLSSFALPPPEMKNQREHTYRHKEYYEARKEFPGSHALFFLYQRVFFAIGSIQIITLLANLEGSRWMI